VETHPEYNECIDIHWMAYHDSSCDFETLKEKGAFSIERHALKIVQPIEPTGVNPDEYQLACKPRSGGGRVWGKIDFSRGFSHWWHLSHIDFHVPSEHTQEGKRYSGVRIDRNALLYAFSPQFLTDSCLLINRQEIQMYHWYSVNASVAGINNEVSAFTLDRFGVQHPSLI
jgi:hypothetical protein